MSSDEKHEEDLLRASALQTANTILQVRRRAEEELLAAKQRLEEALKAQAAIEQTLREQDQRKDEFLATLAHELRNPLAPIRQAALISQAPGATDAQKRWSHEVIARQVQHMSLLLDDLLDVSRITRGKLGLRTKRSELAAIVDAAVETARPAIDAKRHHLTIQLPTEPVFFEADPLRLAQVLSNLLTNAAKYTDPEGTIHLYAAREGDHVTIGVLDTGIGIAPDALPHIFTMFSQVKSLHDRSDGGLGIGLALAKGLAKLHGGDIEARSAGLGQGSEFVVSLPAGRVSEPLHGADDRPDPGSTARKRRILIADDNEDAGQSLCILLRMEGHSVEIAHDGRAALEQFETQHPEVAILDIGMPGLNGYEVARQMRASAGGRELLLVAVTGWGQQTDKALAFAAGFNHHFTKPLEPERIFELLRR